MDIRVLGRIWLQNEDDEDNDDENWLSVVLSMLADGKGFYHSTRQQHYLTVVVVDVWGYIAGGGCFTLLLSLLLLFQAS
jgi:hypothetical protein